MRKAASEFDGWSSGWQPVGLLISVYLGAVSDRATVDGFQESESVRCAEGSQPDRQGVW